MNAKMPTCSQPSHRMESKQKKYKKNQRIIKQVRRQACKKPHGLKQRRRPQFPMPTDRRNHRWQPHGPPIPPRADDLCRRPRDSPRVNVQQKGRRPRTQQPTSTQNFTPLSFSAAEKSV